MKYKKKPRQQRRSLAGAFCLDVGDAMVDAETSEAQLRVVEVIRKHEPDVYYYA